MTLCGRKDGNMSRGRRLNKHIWHLSGRRELGTGVRLVMEIGTVGGEGLSGYWDRGRGLLSPIVGTRRMVRGAKVRGGMREGKGRQVGQLEGFLLCTEGSVDGRFFTAISLVCRRRIMGPGRGRLAHLRAADEDWLALPIKSIPSRANGGSFVWPLFALLANYSFSYYKSINAPLWRRPIYAPIITPRVYFPLVPHPNVLYATE